MKKCIIRWKRIRWDLDTCWRKVWKNRNRISPGEPPPIRLTDVPEKSGNVRCAGVIRIIGEKTALSNGRSLLWIGKEHETFVAGSSSVMVVFVDCCSVPSLSKVTLFIRGFTPTHYVTKRSIKKQTNRCTLIVSCTSSGKPCRVNEARQEPMATS